MDFRKIQKDLMAFAKLERIIAGICILIPLFLITADNGVVRINISDYVYMLNSQIFGLLFGVAAMLFIVNGVIYIKTSGLRLKSPEGSKDRQNNL